ncbi:MAG: DUF1553 domain-containing protein [Planctomycetales bacterium]|nr:DUF1553 domain-containing protein [Planctomycetales bacterium]
MNCCITIPRQACMSVVGLACLWALVWALAASIGYAEEPIVFNRDIRSILSDKCFVCHGPDDEDRQADLRLDDFDSAVAAGAIAPGRPDESSLVQRINTDSLDERMPPDDSGKTLSPDEKRLLTEWIRQGAVYQRHWSFEPIPESITPPNASDGWARNSIDEFVAHRQRQHGFAPAQEVERTTWLRRVTLDLTGLPPTLEELDAFEQDESTDAYEDVVDRLLHSPAYGERMANMWLDVARYADTFGYQADVEMEVWPWRDWVIKAFNRNMPYDQFIIEQIAGDLIPGATQDQKLGTTFNRLHRQTNEGGSIPEEFRLAGIADRTTTAGTAFLGLTLECSRCHDHKFDPIKMRDFYRLSAYFSDIDELGVYSHFTKGVPTPALLLYQDDQRERHMAAQAAVVAAEQAFSQRIAAAREYWTAHADELPDLGLPIREPVLQMSLDGDVDGVAGKATVCDGDNEIKCNGAPEFGRTSPLTWSIWVKPAVEQRRMLLLHQSVAAEDSAFRGLQLTIDAGRPEFSMIHFWPGNAVRIRARQTIPVKQWSHLAVTHDGSGKAAGLALYIDGQSAEVEVIRDELTLDVRHRKEWGDSSVGGVSMAIGARFRDVGFRDGVVDELNVYNAILSPIEVLALYKSLRPNAAVDVTTQMAVEHQLLTGDESVAAARKTLQEARDAENELVTRVRAIMTMRHSDYAAPTHILHRGDYTAKRDEVRPGTPEFIEAVGADGEDRMALAKWITDPRNPLTARVIANRMWHLFFGRGIVVTLEDLGSQGSPPSHPELLDHLARYLIDHQWDLHALCRQIVLSATYRQSSTAADASLLAHDPQNIWLARGPKHRLSAEQLRDTALAASGLLVPTVGGPSVMPYQPAGLWEESGTGKSYHQSTGDGLYRRSMYTFWRRTAPPPSMLTFDATSRESCTARRELTTTPLQALVFLNDPQYVEAARVLAESLIMTHGSQLQGRWDELCRRLVCRKPTDEERRVLDEMYHEQLEYFASEVSQAEELLKVGNRPANDKIDRADLAATTIVAQTMFAFDETIMLR